MKLTIILFIVISSLLNNNEQDIDIRYCKALTFINSSKEIRKDFKIKTKDKDYYKVSEQLISAKLYTPFFKEELKGLDKQMFDTVLIDTGKTVIKTDIDLRKLSLSNNANLIIFFSEIQENCLFAEIMNDIDTYSDSHKDLTQFNTSKVVLFVFGEDANIKNTYIKEFNYN